MDHLSISQLNMLSFCGEQYRRRYILGEKIPPGVSLLVGRATDNSVNANMSNKIDTGELISLEQAKDVARDSLNNEWDREGVLLTDDEAKEGVKKVKGEAVDKSIRLSSLHYTDLAPIIKPTHVQRKWELDMKDYSIILIGYIDLQEGPKSIRDTKTAKKSPPDNAADTSEQLTMYALAAKILDGAIPERLYLDYLVDLKTPKAVSRDTTRTETDFTPLFKRIEIALKILETGLFMPARHDHYLCNPNYCGYYRTCPYVRQSVFPMGG